MAKSIKLSLVDYPHLSRLVFGKDANVNFKVRAGLTNKILSASGEYDEMELLIEGIEVEESDKRMSPAEVMLA